jgi:hypothetical protein
MEPGTPKNDKRKTLKQQSCDLGEKVASATMGAFEDCGTLNG